MPLSEVGVQIFFLPDLCRLLTETSFALIVIRRLFLNSHFQGDCVYVTIESSRAHSAESFADGLCHYTWHFFILVSLPINT